MRITGALSWDNPALSSDFGWMMRGASVALRTMAHFRYESTPFVLALLTIASLAVLSFASLRSQIHVSALGHA